LILNELSNVEIVEAAVSDKSGNVEFIRVLGNTTSSHLAGAKDAAYGELEKISVRSEDIRNIVPYVDFIKMDVEGHESALIYCLNAADFESLDMIVEVGTEKNAFAIYDHLSTIGVNCFSQKKGWLPVKSREDMPLNYKEGSIFISCKTEMPWICQ
jgi:hypothetical protein